MPRPKRPKFQRAGHIGRAATYRGYIRWNLAAIARNRGFVHPKGPFAGRVNIYALQRHTGIPYDTLWNLINKGQTYGAGFGLLAKLCATLNTTPGELLIFDPNMAPEDYALPPAIAATGKEQVQIEW